MKKNDNRREFIKISALVGFLGALAPFNPVKIFTKNAEKKQLEVKIHPKAVKRTLKG